MSPSARGALFVTTALIGVPWLAAALGYWLTGVAG